jgi:hypothetical protein
MRTPTLASAQIAASRAVWMGGWDIDEYVTGAVATAADDVSCTTAREHFGRSGEASPLRTMLASLPQQAWGVVLPRFPFEAASAVPLPVTNGSLETELYTTVLRPGVDDGVNQLEVAAKVLWRPVAARHLHDYDGKRGSKSLHVTPHQLEALVPANATGETQRCGAA